MYFEGTPKQHRYSDGAVEGSRYSTANLTVCGISVCLLRLLEINMYFVMSRVLNFSVQSVLLICMNGRPIGLGDTLAKLAEQRT